VLVASGLEQGPATPSFRDHASFRASLTATVIVAGGVDSTAPGCRIVAIDWRPLAGAARYQVQVRVGAHGAWVAVAGDSRCGQDAAVVGPTAFHDRVVRPAPRRYYRVVAVGTDGRSLDVTTVVPVDVR